MMGYGYGAGGGVWGIFGMLIPLLLLGGIIYIAVRAGSDGGASYNRLRPLDIAEERYARGEITFQELEEIRQNLRKR